jgi:hypothetical protein
MDENTLGPVLSFALLVSGAWVGWRAARLRRGEVSIQVQGFGRGAPKPLRVAAAGCGGAALALVFRLLSERMDSLALAYVAVAVVALSIGIVWGAIMRGWLGSVRGSTP